MYVVAFFRSLEIQQGLTSVQYEACVCWCGKGREGFREMSLCTSEILCSFNAVVGCETREDRQKRGGSPFVRTNQMSPSMYINLSLGVRCGIISLRASQQHAWRARDTTFAFFAACVVHEEGYGAPSRMLYLTSKRPPGNVIMLRGRFTYIGT